ncbi:MAG: dihydrofolate reductase family protein [Rubrobacter sp.]|nr:dihydrofolate reductase family protein [Rubrobacter sp.]
MRKLIVSNITSLDGYYEGPDKNVMALFDYRFEAYPTDESFDAYNAERLRAADTLLLGRTSYDGFKSFWPSVADDPDARPIEREISRLNNAIDKAVVSDSLTPEDTEPWRNTRIISRGDAHEQIAELKRQPGKDILVFGSRTLWNDLLAYGLVDELHLMISPVVLSTGTPTFATQPGGSLRLTGTRTWEGSGIVLVRYEASRK